MYLLLLDNTVHTAIAAAACKLHRRRSGTWMKAIDTVPIMSRAHTSLSTTAALAPAAADLRASVCWRVYCVYCMLCGFVCVHVHVCVCMCACVCMCVHLCVCVHLCLSCVCVVCCVCVYM
jgi:hypothetical protein